MYIWVILATFVTALYGFNLAVREDIRDLTIIPIAEALVSKVVIQHVAAQDYSKYNKNSIKSSSNSTLVMDKAKIKNFAPTGFVFDNNEVYTAIYCVNVLNPKFLVPCNNANASRFLMSFSPLPPQWTNPRTKIPSKDLFVAIKKVMGRNSAFGYAGAKRKDMPDPTRGIVSDIEIKNNEGSISEDITRVFVPEGISKTEDYTKKCTNSKYCLVFLTKVY